MRNQADDFDLSNDGESLELSVDDNEIREKIETAKKMHRDVVIGPNIVISFGKKTIRHFLQERNISEMLNIREFAKQEGFKDSKQLSELIDALIKEKRREFTLGRGRKGGKLFIWKRRASQVPLRNLSLFQLVCTMKESILVKKYLEQGVDVNGQIDTTYNGEFSGRSPLHLALSHLASLSNSQQKLLTAYLLLHYGANVHAKDSQGNTPLHALFSGAPFNKQLFDIIMENGADSSAVNNRGETAFELLVASSSNLDIENYIEVGGCINRFNSHNRRGCISEIIRRVSAERIGSSLSLMEIDGQGRTAIHNVVSFSLAKMKDEANNELYYDDMQTIIESILKQGGDINCQDEYGKTPLHYAATFRNSQSVSLLLQLGADMNVCDISGKSALASSLDFPTIVSSEELMRNNSVIKTFMLHLYKLQTSGLLISQENKQNFDRASFKYKRDIVGEKDFHCEWEKSKGTLMGTSTLMLHDLISETGIISSYPRLLPNERNAIDHYFENFHRKDFSGLGGLLVAQYHKAQARSLLVQTAANSLNSLIGNCIPDSCTDCIFKYLKNEDLENLILVTDTHEPIDN